MSHRIFIGYDPRQAIAYNVLQHSIVCRSREPVNITPLIIEQLPLHRRGLTAFTFTRFLVPWLCDYQGWALFLDADMLCQADIGEVFAMARDEDAVLTVMVKWGFERAAMMLFNCGHPDNKILTPEFIESASELHKIGWTQQVGQLPEEWHHIVLYNEPRTDAKLVHFTGGIPVFEETVGCEYTKEYHQETRFLMSTVPWKDIMGPSVHVKRVLDAKKATATKDESGTPERFADVD